jgi:hypothetical protein
MDRANDVDYFAATRLELLCVYIPPTTAHTFCTPFCTAECEGFTDITSTHILQHILHILHALQHSRTVVCSQCSVACL